MTVVVFTLLILLAAYCAGLLGSLTGLGGGVVVIPFLTLGFGIDFHYAVGAALVSTIATSSGSGSAYVKEGITNVRLGMFLEVATTVGAVTGAFVAVWLNSSVIAVIFGFVLILTVIMQQRRKLDHEGVVGSEAARRLKLFGVWPQRDGTLKHYELRNVGRYGLRFGRSLRAARYHSPVCGLPDADRRLTRCIDGRATPAKYERKTLAADFLLRHSTRGTQYAIQRIHR